MKHTFTTKKLHTTLITLTSSLLLLTACGASDKKDTSTETKSEKQISTLAKVIITGDVTEKIEDSKIDSMMVCEKNGAALAQNEFGVSIYQEITKKNLEINIPMQSLKVGTQKVIGSHDGDWRTKIGVVTVHYMGQKYNTYKENGEGNITLTNIPTKAGEYLTGTLTASISKKHKKDQKISIDATFNIQAQSYAFDKCKYGEAFKK